MDAATASIPAVDLERRGVSVTAPVRIRRICAGVSPPLAG
jgi:hypothetical protein